MLEAVAVVTLMVEAVEQVDIELARLFLLPLAVIQSLLVLVVLVAITLQLIQMVVILL